MVFLWFSWLSECELHPETSEPRRRGALCAQVLLCRSPEGRHRKGAGPDGQKAGLKPWKIDPLILYRCNWLLYRYILYIQWYKGLYTHHYDFFQISYNYWLVVWTMIVYFHIQLGISSSQLTNSYFSEAQLYHQSDQKWRSGWVLLSLCWGFTSHLRVLRCKVYHHEKVL